MEGAVEVAGAVDQDESGVGAVMAEFYAAANGLDQPRTPCAGRPSGRQGRFHAAQAYSLKTRERNFRHAHRHAFLLALLTLPLAGCATLDDPTAQLQDADITRARPPAAT